MNEKNQRLLSALGDVDEKFVDESAQTEKRGMKRIIAAAVVVAISLSLALYLFVPYGAPKSDLSAYKRSEYYELIKGLDEYSLSFARSEYDNNFEKLVAAVDDLFAVRAPGFSVSDDSYFEINGDASNGAAADDSNMSPRPDASPNTNGAEGNGSYVEATDNQVADVIEADLFKMTDKYIFRISKHGTVLNIYSIAKENSECVNSVDLLELADSTSSGGQGDAEIYLSEDCNTLMLLMSSSIDYKRYFEIFSFDVSDVHNVSFNGKISIQGSLNTSRMADGKLLLATGYSFERKDIDYSDPSTFVPNVDSGDGFCPIDAGDIVMPERVRDTTYTMLTIVDMTDLEIIDTMAVLGYASDVYVSRDSIYIIDEKSWMDDLYGNFESKEDFVNTTDITIVDYSADSFEYKGSISTDGALNNQYSLDERDGYLRVVTSTVNVHIKKKESAFKQNKNVSLYIFDLSDNTLAYSVENFAIEGEEATSVRFDGDTLYVCTAEVITFSDPVYFFDLSDYENITYTDTGIIDGYSSSLINLGDGFLLGVGMEGWGTGKVEVYKEGDDGVSSVDKFLFYGDFSEEYKAYLVNREEDLFGFAVWAFVPVDEELEYPCYDLSYVLMHFDGEELLVASVSVIEEDFSYWDEADYVRAAYIDGYLYITTPLEIVVEKIN